MAAVAANFGDIEKGYQDVRDDKTDTKWIILEYKDEKDELYIAKKGTGDWEEFKSNLKPDLAQFGFVRFNYSNDEYSQRAKFILVCWCGPNVKIMRRAKVTVQIADVKTIFKSFAVEIQTSDLSDLKEGEVIKLIKKAGGANYDRQTSDY